MANNLISMCKLRQILKMHCEGHSKQSIATLHRVSRNTVRRHILHFECLKITTGDLNSLSDMELEAIFRQDSPVSLVSATRLDVLYKFFPEADKQLRKRGMTLLRLWYQYIEQQHPDGYQQTAFLSLSRLMEETLTPVRAPATQGGRQDVRRLCGREAPHS
jgi:hypothetical protein